MSIDHPEHRGEPIDQAPLCFRCERAEFRVQQVLVGSGIEADQIGSDPRRGGIHVSECNWRAKCCGVSPDTGAKQFKSAVFSDTRLGEMLGQKFVQLFCHRHSPFLSPITRLFGQI